MNKYFEILLKVYKMSEETRNSRLLEFFAKGDDNMSSLDIIEFTIIQSIRMENGELDELIEKENQQF